MKIWYFHGQYKASGLGTNIVSYNVFDLPRMSKVAGHFQKKNELFIYSIHLSIQTNRVEKYQKTRLQRRS